MDKQKFIEQFVEIEWVENSDCFGHYPFQLYVEAGDGNKCIALATDMRGVMEMMDKELKGYEKAFIALDFPAIDDMKTDFLAILCLSPEKQEISAITYNAETGDILNNNANGKALDNILSQIVSMVPAIKRS